MRRTAPHCGQRRLICSSIHTPTAYPATVSAIVAQGFFSARVPNVAPAAANTNRPPICSLTANSIAPQFGHTAFIDSPLVPLTWTELIPLA